MFKIEFDSVPESDWLPDEAFASQYDDLSTAIAVAVEGVSDGGGSARVVRVEDGKIVWRSRGDQNRFGFLL